ncbi:MAG: ribosomal protein S18-alanine N-acetyltransferase [Aquificaceae bacterium]
MVIREMTKQDLEEVINISQECFGKDAWSRKAFEKEFNHGHSYRFVIEEDGRILGYAIVWKMYDEVVLMSIAVRKELWGKGIGKSLMLFLVDCFKGKAKKFILDVRRSNLRAIRLYQSLGFKIIYERQKYYSDGENAFLMALDLEEKDGDKRQEVGALDTGGEASTKG